jgi:hypothetical protein
VQHGKVERFHRTLLEQSALPSALQLTAASRQ